MSPRKTLPADGRIPSVKASRRSLTAGAAARAHPAQQSLALTSPKPLPKPAPKPPETARCHAPARGRPLWLCCHFPALSLEALNSFGAATTEAVFELVQGQRRVLLANSRAGHAGISPGLSVNAALALLPTLHLAERNPEKERRALQYLAARAERFTSIVSLEAPDVLLLEIGGSLQLFGTPGNLRQDIEDELVGRGFQPTMAIAPTPLASLWLARAGRQLIVEDTASLPGVLAPLPLYCPGWPEALRESLNGMGIYSIGDCLRLPRQGFAQRFGAAKLLQLDRALGRLPDPRKSYRAAERFCEECELSEEQSDSERLLEVCRQLLSRLERFLTTRQLEVRHVQFSFFHLRSPATHLTLGCVQAGRRAEQWFELLAIRFERFTLPEPVIALRLRSGPGQALQTDNESLFASCADRAKGRGQHGSISHLMERLRARLGDEAIHGVATVAEHRPQYAFSRTAVTGSPLPQAAAPRNDRRAADCAPLLLADMRQSGSLLLRRPLWMLPEPLPLAGENGKPSYRGSLKLVNGPERLETGWWDGNDIARDYFVASNPEGVYLWIYRNRKRSCHGDGRWYLHGIFG